MKVLLKGFGIVLAGAVIGFLMLVAVDGLNLKRYHKASSNTPPALSSRDLELQAGRERLIRTFKDDGYIYKIEQLAQHPHAYVTPRFMRLNIDDKNSVLNIIWIYYKTKDPKAHSVVVKDSQTGRQIGTYAEVYGGLKLN